jgi:CubicO group peptidase (beta-lactamase class C family)
MSKRLILQVLTLASLCGLLAAQPPQTPDTPAGRQFAHWLEVFNRGQRDELQKFLQENDPEARIDQQMDFRRMTGGFDFKKVEESAPDKLTGIVKERDSDNIARFTMEVDPAPPHQFKQFGLQLIPLAADSPAPARLSESEAIVALQAEIQKRTAEDRFAGAVMIAKGHQVVFSGAYGLADREHDTPNRLDTRFRIGSMNKMFTATAVLQLAQAGKLKLTDPIGKYLTDYPNKEIAAKVTVHRLLTHTGGTGDIFGPDFEKNRLTLRTLASYVALYGKRAPEFEPGARFAYSNYGFILLGVLVEKVSGQSYYDYVREHIFQPAGMTRTDSFPEEEKVDGRAVGYMYTNEKWQPNNDTLPVRGTSAGGGYSTVADLAHFANAVMEHKLLNAEYTELLTTGKVEGGPGGKYAYGFSDATAGGVRWLGHGGGAPGMNGDLKFSPDSGYIVAILANLDPPAATRIADFIAARLPSR